ncbi:uroporphyrin-III C-methyltransferase [Burkholderiales bacterium JOSHI_001]|nr:uroporphyrin-III C-methyltransferase [Burkholderiales bacterium JOSHI_001]
MKPQPSRPWCALVGAGPGDPELLTLKALRTLRRATVLLVDDLVNPAIVQMALAGRKRPPRVVHVGKRGGCRSTPQAFIEKLMLHEALAGERVVRVKGGDPFIFGRGGEEAATLRAQGVTVEVVNGITAGLAAASGIGVPLTHRDHAQGVMLVTGHAREGGQAPDWAVLGAAAAQGLTLVVYMGMSRLADLQAGLLRALPARTPVAVVQHASLPTQRHAAGRLDGLVQMVATHRLASPAVLIVGDVLQGLAQLPLPTAAAA